MSEEPSVHRPWRPFVLAGAGALVALGLFASSAWATAAYVRVEGQANRSARNVNTTGAGVPGNAACKPNSAGEALEIATGGHWDRKSSPTTILNETHTYANRDYWQFWVNGILSQNVGLCDYIVQPGDEIMLTAQVDDAAGNGTRWPSYFAAPPATVPAGQPFSVRVVEHVAINGATTQRPLAGANVQNGSSSAVSDANGNATLTAPAAGSFWLYAWKPGAIPTNQPFVRVVPPPVQPPVNPPVQPPTPPSTPSAPPQIQAQLTPESKPVTIDDSSAEETAAEQVMDAKAIRVRFTGIRDRRHFARGRGPRALHASVTHGGVAKSVQLRLRRKTGRACSAFDSRAGRFQRIRCSSSASWFPIGDKAGWSYTFPSRLPKGLYRADVRATNDAGHHSPVYTLHFRVR